MSIYRLYLPVVDHSHDFLFVGVLSQLEPLFAHDGVGHQSEPDVVATLEGEGHGQVLGELEDGHVVVVRDTGGRVQHNQQVGWVAAF